MMDPWRTTHILSTPNQEKKTISFFEVGIKSHAPVPYGGVRAAEQQS